MSSSIPITVTPSNAPCRFYAYGRCTKRDSCPFRHAEEPREGATTSSTPLTPILAKMSRATVPCSFFARGSCKRGTDCMYSHENDPATASLVVHHSEGGSGQRDHVPKDSRSQVQCTFFAKGTCSKGHKCTFAHSGDTVDVAKEARTSKVGTHLAFPQATQFAFT